MNQDLFKRLKFKRKPQTLLFYLRALKHFRLFFLRSFYNPPWKSGRVEISLSFDPGVLESWDHMKTFLLALFLSVSNLFSFFKVVITNWYCQIWANIFLEGVPFVCSSNYFPKISKFSWTLKKIVCFSFCMFDPRTN